MLWGELPLSLEGTDQQAKSGWLQQALCLPMGDLCSAWKWEKCRMHPQRGRAAQIVDPGKRQRHLEEHPATSQKLRKSCLALFWRKCNRISISSWLKTREGNYLLTYIFFLENMFFSSNHIDVYLQESQVMLNASSSASRNLPGSTKINGVAHISNNLASSCGVSSGSKPCFY